MLTGEQIYFAHFMWSPGNCSCIKCLEKQSYWKWLIPFGLGFYLDRIRHWHFTTLILGQNLLRQRDDFCTGLWWPLGWLAKMAVSCWVCSLPYFQPQNNAWHRRCKLNMYWINDWVPRKYWGGQKWMSHLESGRGSSWGFSKTLFVQPKMISFSYFWEAMSTYRSQWWPVV